MRDGGTRIARAISWMMKVRISTICSAWAEAPSSDFTLTPTGRAAVFPAFSAPRCAASNWRSTSTRASRGIGCAVSSTMPGFALFAQNRVE